LENNAVFSEILAAVPHSWRAEATNQADILNRPRLALCIPSVYPYSPINPNIVCPEE